MFSRILLLLGLVAVLGAALQLREDLRKKLEANDEVVTVHLIAHTHDDPGWLKTVDEYYSGTNNGVVRIGVVYILDSVVEELVQDPNKKFTYVEISYFWRWWEEQSDDIKETVRKLVQNGQFEFANGGWVMNDEAACHYEDIIEQMTLGHQFLLKEFGVKPTIGWHLDPFGHSSAQPYMFSQMGFEAWFFARMHYQDQEYRTKNQELEFMWTPLGQDTGDASTLSASETAIFTHMMYGPLYCIPPGFTWDQLGCEDEIVNDPRLQGYNEDDIVNQFIQDALIKRDGFRHPEVLFPMGCDFHFQNAHLNYENMDKLIAAINKAGEGKVRAIYSTPQTYMKAVKTHPEVVFPTNYWDFFTYAESENSYWSGYFTSRPTVKGYVRDMSNLFRSASKSVSLFAIQETADKNEVQNAIDSLTPLRRAVSLLQHHDGVTGTEKQHVAFDYDTRLYLGEGPAKDAFATSIARRLKIDNPLTMCVRTNSTFKDCPTASLTVGSKMLLVVDNPGNSISNEILEVRVPNGLVFSVTSGTQELDNDVICHFENNEECVLFFASNLGGFSVTSFTLAATQEGEGVKAAQYFQDGTIQLPHTADMMISLSHTLETDQFVYKVTQGSATKLETKLKMDYRYYNSFQGQGQTSGAYIFRPDPANARPQEWAPLTHTYVYQGKVVTEFWHEREHVSELIRLNKNGQIEVRTFMKGIPLSTQGTEVTFNVQTEYKNKGVFYTDSTGMAMQKRELNKRPQPFNYTTVQPISSNYFPLTSTILFDDLDSEKRVSVFTDRAQGGAVIDEGMIEVMINRRLYRDDFKGVNEALNETDANGKALSFWLKHIVQILDLQAVQEASKQGIELLNRHTEMKLNQPVQLFFGEVTGNSPSTIALQELDASSEMKDLKVNLFPKARGVIRLRIQNVRDAIDHNTQDPLTVNVNSLAAVFYFLVNSAEKLPSISIQPLNLSANQPYSEVGEVRSWTWITEDGVLNLGGPRETKDDMVVQLAAQEFRVFEITYNDVTQEALIE